MTGRSQRCHSLMALLLVLTGMIMPDLEAETTSIPESVQVQLFSKIWMFDRSLAKNDEVVMAILYQSTYRASSEARDRLIEAVRAGGLKIRCVPVALDDPEHVADTLQAVSADVFYVTEMRAINIAEVVRISRSRHVRTITVVPGYMGSGVAISLRVRDDKPNIVVNLSAAIAEGSDLTAQLLKFSTLISTPAGQ